MMTEIQGGFEDKGFFCLLGGVGSNEEDVSAEQPQTQEGARFPQTDEHEERPQGSGRTPQEGAESDQRLTRRMKGPRLPWSFSVLFSASANGA
jgi:hypothetical protein